MPSKKKKYNSRFPPARIKKIMQSDEEVGKVAQVVPIIISKALEIFVESLLKSSSDVTRSRNARTLTPNHIKAAILSNDEFQFLKELAQTIPEVNPGAEAEDDEMGANTTTTATTQPSQPTATHQRKVNDQRIKTTAGADHHMSSTGQTAAIGFRTRGRPRKRLIESLESQTSVQSIQSSQSVGADEDDEETEVDEEEEDEADDDEDSQPLSSDNNVNRINNSQTISNNNNKYLLPTIRPPVVSTGADSSLGVRKSLVATQQSMSASVSLKMTSIEEDDDYDN